MGLFFNRLWPAAFAVTAIACGGSDTPAPVDDGRFHPAPNGIGERDSDACFELSSDYASRSGLLGCVGTTSLCPNFLSDAEGVVCGEWDAGTVDGCAEYIMQQTNCDDLAGALANCAVVPIGCQ